MVRRCNVHRQLREMDLMRALLNQVESWTQARDSPLRAQDFRWSSQWITTLGKAAVFPKEGGGAILRMEMPESVANFGSDLLGNEVRFNRAGTDALGWNWDKVKTTVTPVESTKDAAR